MRLLLALVVTGIAVTATASAKIPPPPVEALVVPTGRGPCGLAADGDAIWVGVYEAGLLLSLDPAGRVERRIRVGRWACRIAVDDRAIWVTRDRANEVVRVDRRSARVRRVSVSSPFDLALADGGLWATSFETGTVTRIDPVTARATRVLRIGGHPAGIAACGGRLWVGHGRDATWLTSIDPRTGRSRRFDVIAESPGWPRCVRGELWVTTQDAVLQVSPRTGELHGHLALGGTPAEAASARSAISGFWMIWVTDKERSVVHRIVSGHVVDSFPAGPGAYALARFGGSVWITSFAGADVRRYDP